MKRTIAVTAMALAGCTRGGSSASEGTTSRVGVAARDSAAGVVPSSAGGEVMLGPASDAPMPRRPIGTPGTRPVTETPGPPTTGSVRPL
jgi:hypothetical protein